jgi:hypothetical protein
MQLRIELGEADEQVRQQLEEDPAFKDANTRWSRCMNDAGHPGQKDPVTLLKSMPRGTDLNRSPAAQADVDCKTRTDYFNVAYARLQALQTTWIQTHADTINTWNTLQQHQDDIARQLLAEA